MSQIKIALFIALFGTLILSIIWQIQEPEKIKISKSKNYINKKVQITGEIIETKIYQEFQIITLDDLTGKINGIIYSNKKISGNVRLVGEIQKYKNQTEIEIQKLMSLNP